MLAIQAKTQIFIQLIFKSNLFMKKICLFLIFITCSCWAFSQSDGQFSRNSIYLKTQSSLSGKILPCSQCDSDWENWDVQEDLKQILSKYKVVAFEKAFKIPSPSLNDIYKVTIGDTVTSLDLFINELNKISSIVYAEKIPQVTKNYVPDDLDPAQWALSMVNAQEAWDITKGSQDIVIAIVDDAVRLSHQDISPNLWVNTGEIAGNNMDDDGNGYVDDVNGYDVADNQFDPSPPTNAFDGQFSHGTHVAGIACAATDNGVGIAGLGFNCKIMAVKTKRSASLNSRNLDAPYEGVAYAIAAGADVINMSWGSPFASETGQLLMDAAHEQGIVLVAAAGNDNSQNTFYPAAYNHVISVAATDQSDSKASFSNYGDWIDIAAPGVGILSTTSGSDDEYDSFSGTSMASPLVAGLVGLVLSVSPDMSPERVEECLKSSSSDLDNQNSGFAGLLGAGRIDAKATLECLQAPPVPEFTANILQSCPSQEVSFENMSAGVDIISYSWSFPGGTPSVSTEENPVVTYATEGTYDVELTVTNAYGTETILKTGFITVAIPQASISGSASIIQGGTAQLEFSFTGNPPYSFTYSDGSMEYTETGIMNSPYFVNVSPESDQTYELTEFGDSFCSGTVSGSADVKVINAENSGNCEVFTIFGDVNRNTTPGHIYNPVEDSYYILSTMGSSTITISRLDNDGILERTRAFSFGSANIVLRNVAVAPNGDILAGGSYNGSHLMVVRFDASCNLLWSREYDQGNDRFGNFVQGTGDTYYTACWIGGSGGDDFIVQKIDGNGDPIWSYQYDVTSGDDQIFTVESNGNGGILIVGQRASGGIPALYVDIDSNGDVQQSSLFRFSSGTYSARSVYRTALGETYISGNVGSGTSHTMFLLKLDSSGDIVWTREASGVTLQYPPSKMTTDIYGNVYVATTTNLAPASYGNTSSITVFKYSANGDLIWTKALPALNSVSEFTSTPVSGELVISGHTNKAGSLSLGEYDVYFAVTDTSMSTCQTIEVVSSPISHQWSRIDMATGVSNVSYNVSSLTPSYVPNNFQYANLCGPLSNFEVSKDVLCLDESLQLTNTSFNVDSYEWLINGQVVSTDENLGDQNFNNTGDVLIQLRGISEECTSTKSEVVSVVDTCQSCDLVADFSGDSILCPGDEVTFSNLTDLDDTAAEYEWIFGSSATPASSSLMDPPAVSFAGPGRYEVTLNVTTASCGTVSVTKQILVYSEPAVDPISDETLCSGESLQFPKVDGFDYLWSPETGLSDPTVSNPEVTLNDESVEYIVRITSQTTGCFTYDTVVVTAYPLPELMVSKDTSFCQPTELTLYAESNMEGGEYLWSTGETESSIVVAPEENTDYSVTYTSENGCEATGMVSVFVSGVSITASSETACPGDDVYLNASTECLEVQDPGVCAPVNPEPMVNCEDCSLVLSGNMSYNLNPGEKACVPEGVTFTGGINMNGGELVICGTAIPAYLNLNSGSIYVLGEAEFPNFNMNGTTDVLYNYGDLKAMFFSINGKFVNYGTFEVQFDFNVNSQAEVLNEGEIHANSSLNNNNVFINSGPLQVSGSLRNNGGAYFENECHIDISDNFHVNSEFYNYGSIRAGKTSYLNSSKLVMAENAKLKTYHAFFNSLVEGPVGGCSKIEVENYTTINGGASFTGNLDLCDINGIETNNVTLPGSVSTDCSCSADGLVSGSGGTGELTYSWTPVAGLDNPSIANPTANITEATTYTVTISNGVESITESIRIELETFCVVTLVEINVEPNPFSSQVRVNTMDIEDDRLLITVISTTGKVMYNKAVENLGNIDIHTRDFAPGIYLVKVTTENEVYTRKIIKQ